MGLGLYSSTVATKRSCLTNTRDWILQYILSLMQSEQNQVLLTKQDESDPCREERSLRKLLEDFKFRGRPTYRQTTPDANCNMSAILDYNNVCDPSYKQQGAKNTLHN